MSRITEIILFAFLSGFMIFLGGLLAGYMEQCCKRTVESYLVHWSVAFGGGALVSAVAFVLTPKGIEFFSPVLFTLFFLSGALVFFVLDRAIEQKGGLLAQTMAMLMDFIPEAIALGAVFVHDHRMGILLAFFIGVQNFPEAFNAFFDLRKNGHSKNKILQLFFFLSFLGVFAALAGTFLLNTRPGITVGIMLFAAGGILYLIFQDIAPSSKLQKHWEPALGACLGFLVGMIGTKMLG